MRLWRHSAAVTGGLVLAALAGAGQAAHHDPFVFFNRLVTLDQGDLARIDEGDVAVRVLPGRDRHLGVFAAVRVDASSQRLVEWFRYVNQSQVDLLGGLFGGVKRKLIERRLAGEGGKAMRLARARLERGPPAAANGS
jgi:hypothetical protein